MSVLTAEQLAELRERIERDRRRPGLHTGAPLREAEVDALLAAAEGRELAGQADPVRVSAYADDQGEWLVRVRVDKTRIDADALEAALGHIASVLLHGGDVVYMANRGTGKAWRPRPDATTPDAPTKPLGRREEAQEGVALPARERPTDWLPTKPCKGHPL